MEVVKFKAEHLDAMALQPAQQYLVQYVEEGMSESLEMFESFTGIIDGKIVLCAGVLPYWEGRGYAWANLSADAGMHMAAIHRAVKRYLDVAPFDRIEAAVDVEFEAGHRWIKLLGFELEAPSMKRFRPDGGACSLYARTR